MGLLTNNDKPCPICGEATPRLLATTIANEMPICSDCSKKISMAETKLAQLSVAELKVHLSQREENARQLEEVFRPNYSVDITWTSLNIDEANELFTLPIHECGDIKNPPIFKYEELNGYELHDEHGLIEHCHRGEAAPQLISTDPTPAIYESERISSTISRHYKLHLFFSNPYWDKVEVEAGTVVTLKSQFVNEYTAFMERFNPVTFALAAMMGVDASTYVIDADTIAEEIKKFEELRDAGIITEEEFNEKKNQLLGN